MTMPELQFFKTLWGHEGSFAQACERAVAAGFAGIEGPAPADRAQADQWRELLRRHDLRYIAEITTAGSYVPQRDATLAQHLDDLAAKLRASVYLEPEFVTCLGGCDAWPESQSRAFFEGAMTLADEYAVTISFETHRGRSLFTPWVTERLCQELPEMKLTCDFSHWCVVCERLIDTDLGIEAGVEGAKGAHAELLVLAHHVADPFHTAVRVHGP